MAKAVDEGAGRIGLELAKSPVADQSLRHPHGSSAGWLRPALCRKRGRRDGDWDWNRGFRHVRDLRHPMFNMLLEVASEIRMRVTRWHLERLVAMRRFLLDPVPWRFEVARRPSLGEVHNSVTRLRAYFITCRFAGVAANSMPWAKRLLGTCHGADSSRSTSPPLAATDTQAPLTR